MPFKLVDVTSLTRAPRQHVLPPTSICPTVLDRQRSTMGRPASRPEPRERLGESCVDIGPGSFQISPEPDCEPLLVFVNPKSGGRQVSRSDRGSLINSIYTSKVDVIRSFIIQGAKLYRKFLYHLNPRQVYNLGNGGPGPGLNMFREVESVIIVVCGGDGTVGWVLETLGEIQGPIFCGRIRIYEMKNIKIFSPS